MATLFGMFPILETLFAEQWITRTEICEALVKGSAASRH